MQKLWQLRSKKWSKLSNSHSVSVCFHHFSFIFGHQFMHLCTGSKKIIRKFANQKHYKNTKVYTPLRLMVSQMQLLPTTTIKQVLITVCNVITLESKKKPTTSHSQGSHAFLDFIFKTQFSTKCCDLRAKTIHFCFWRKWIDYTV